MAPVRVVVCDDSSFMRSLLADALRAGGYQVVGVAGDGEEAVRLCRDLRPDVLTLDLAMPKTDGLGVLRALRSFPGEAPAVVVVSSFSPAFGARAMDALAEGAHDLVAKPKAGQPVEAFLADLCRKVEAAGVARGSPASSPPLPGRPSRPDGRHPRAVVIAASTGGPRALMRLFPDLPSPLGCGALVVQHMPPGFTASLAQRLDSVSLLRVREAAGGESVEPESALVAPGGRHLRVDGQGCVYVSDEPEVDGLRPRADLTIADAAQVFQERLLLVVLTGMGSDGLAGAREVKQAGGRVVVEAASSCTIYGMPRAVVEADLADAVVDLSSLADVIRREAQP